MPVVAGGKWHGSREGEAYEEEEVREEVVEEKEGNLDPGMNDPPPLGTRGDPLSALAMGSTSIRVYARGVKAKRLLLSTNSCILFIDLSHP